MGIMLPVIEVNCKYKVSAKYADNIIVKTNISKLTPTRIQFDYSIFREDDNVLLVEGFTEHIYMSKESGKPVNLKKINESLYEKLQQIVS